MNFPKLVRDKIPEIIETSGKSHSIRFVHGREADKFLIRKMIEEVSEFEETPCVEEAADIYEVFLAFLDNWNLDISDVKNAANEKKDSRGGFYKGIVLERVYDKNKANQHG